MQPRLDVARRQHDRRRRGRDDDDRQSAQHANQQSGRQDQQSSCVGLGRGAGGLDDADVGVGAGDGVLKARVLCVFGDAAIGGFRQGALPGQFAITRADLDQLGQPSACGLQRLSDFGAARAQARQFAARRGQLGLDLLADRIGAAADKVGLGLGRGGDLGLQVGDLAVQFDDERIVVRVTRGGDALALAQKPGPKVGALLDAVERWWIAGDFAADRAACLAELEKRAQGT